MFRRPSRYSFLMTWDTSLFRKRNAPPRARRASSITIPAHAHPLSRLIFELMFRQGKTYSEIADRSGILHSTMKSIRCRNIPSLTTIESLLTALDHQLVAVPSATALPHDLRADLEPIAKKHGESLEHLVAAVVEFRTIGAVLRPDGQARVREEVDRGRKYAARRAAGNAGKRGALSGKLANNPAAPAADRDQPPRHHPGAQTARRAANKSATTARTLRSPQ